MKISYSKQNITSMDIEAVIACLKSEMLTQGPLIDRFESKISNFLSVKSSLVLSSATAGLHCAYKACGVDENSRVWVPANTFVSTSNAALYCGAKIDFLDISPETNNICIGSLEDKLLRASQQGKLPDLIVPVHFAGLRADMEGLLRLKEIYNFMIIEDAAHSFGSSDSRGLRSLSVGSSAAVFSFHPVKIITTGEGGAVIACQEILDKVRMLRSHGLVGASAGDLWRGEERWAYEQLDLGFHYRMTDIQAALGISQLARIEENLAARARLAERYSVELKKLDLPIKLPVVSNRSANHLYVCKLSNESPITQKTLFRKMKSLGITLNLHYIPVYKHPIIKERCETGQMYLPNAESYFRSAFSLPMYYGLTIEEQDYVIASLVRVFD